VRKVHVAMFMYHLIVCGMNLLYILYNAYISVIRKMLRVIMKKLENAPNNETLLNPTQECLKSNKART
jgi:hypothetical protein